MWYMAMFGVEEGLRRNLDHSRKCIANGYHIVEGKEKTPLAEASF